MNTVKIHRLVAETFIPNPKNKPQVNHKDGNKLNNAIYNLEWTTQLENMQHAWKNKLICGNKGNKGENNPRSKLTWKDVEFIRKNYKPYDKNFGAVALAKHFNVHRDSINRIVNKKYWK